MTRHLAHRWARVGTLLDGTDVGERLQQGAAEGERLLHFISPGGTARYVRFAPDGE